MSVIQLLILSSALYLGTAGAWNQPNICYTKQAGCSNGNEQHQLLRDNILLVQQSLEKDIQALRTSLQSYSDGHLVQCRNNETGNNGTDEDTISDLREQILNLETKIQAINETFQQQEQELQAQNMEIQEQKTGLQNLNMSLDLNDIVTEVIGTLSARGNILNPANSCEEIPSASQPGEFWITDNDNQSPTRVYCDTSVSCGDNTREWTRVAYIDMTDPNQQCPNGFTLITRTEAPLRTCSRAGSTGGCLSTTFPVNGIEYSQVYGRIKAYGHNTPDGFYQSITNSAITIDDDYVDGVSLTHGQTPRQHIWTFSTSSNAGGAPPFVGQDYFCEHSSNFVDPLWDGQGCTLTCCSLNNPPWFCKELPQPTTDNIELRLCLDQGVQDENIPIELVEIYIQ